LASGYWNGGELRQVADAESGGWYHTGDIGELDAEGNLFFKGRKKDVIVTPAGMNVYPEDLQSALQNQPEVKEALVVPLAIGGNAEPCAVLILRDRNADAAQVVDHANQGLAEYQRIRRWVVWPDEDFPRTSNQKPRRAEVLAEVERMLEAKQHDSPAVSTPLTQLISRVTRRPVAGMSKDAKLDSDLNLSSLDRVELLGALEERYQIDLSETSFSEVNTVGDLERILKGESTAMRARYHYPEWVQRWPHTWIRIAIHYLLLRPAIFFLGWPRIRGRENLRGLQGPVLVISNHIGHVDVGFVLTALPARFRHKLATAAGGERLEILRTPPSNRNILGRWLDRTEWFLGVTLLNIFPLPRDAGFRDSFAYAGQSVDRGYSILVFPEGHHTTTGKLLPFRAGIGLLVKNLRIPVVPMRIDGLYELKQAGKHMARPFQVTVTIGAPMRFEADAEAGQIAAELQQSIEQL